MPLDPKMEEFLVLLTAAGMPPDFAAIGAAAAKENTPELIAMLGQGPAMERVEDRQFQGPAGPMDVRVYVPGRDVAGLLVFYHGGGWVLGSIAAYDAACRRLALAANCALVSVEYRMAPEHVFPAAVEDCYAALLWAAGQAEAIAGRPVPLAVTGDSAGGNLAAVVALLARDRAGPALAMQLLIYPVTDADFTTSSYTEFAKGYMLEAKSMHWFWDQYVPDVSRRADPMVSPLRAESLAGLPAAMMETAGYDPLRDEGEAYAARLEAAGVPVTLRRWDGLCHGFFQMAMILQPAGEAVDQMGADFRAALAAIHS